MSASISTSMCFFGGVASANNLTGSCTAVTIERSKRYVYFLIDTGMIQGNARDFMSVNRRILENVDPEKVDYVIITHAHIDHVGLLPLLVNHKFKGKVICTKQTAELMRIMLEDSYKIQAEMLSKNEQQSKNAHYPKKRKGRNFRLSGISGRENKGPRKFKLLYNMKDIGKTLGQIHAIDFGKDNEYKLSVGIMVHFIQSGHVLGGAVCIIETTDPRTNKHSRIAFSGDLGRNDGFLLNPPDRIAGPVNVLAIESTYGGTVHPQKNDEILRLYEIITEAHRLNKKIIIPSFALQRSQELVYLLSAAMEENKIPPLPIYLDSPMATRITQVFAEHWSGSSFRNIFGLKFNPFSEDENTHLTFVMDPDESASLVRKTGAFIVISSSGMCDAGRVREHLRGNLQNSQAIICLVGYMIPSSLGRKLQDKQPIIRMNNEEIEVKAEINVFKSFSAHPDCNELAEYARLAIRDIEAAQTIFILHGEAESGAALQERLTEMFEGQGVSVERPNLFEKRRVNFG